MSIREKIKKIEQDNQEKAKKEEEIQKEIGIKKRENMLEILNEKDKYNEKILKYCDKMAHSLGIYKSIDELEKEMGKESNVEDYYAYEYTGKKFQIFEWINWREVLIEVDVVHRQKKYNSDNTSEEVKKIFPNYER